MLDGAQQLKRLAELKRELEHKYDRNEEIEFANIEKLEMTERYRDAQAARDRLPLEQRAKLIKWLELRREVKKMEEVVQNAPEPYIEMDSTESTHQNSNKPKKSKRKCIVS